MILQVHLFWGVFFETEPLTTLDFTEKSSLPGQQAPPRDPPIVSLVLGLQMCPSHIIFLTQILEPGFRFPSS